MVKGPTPFDQGIFLMHLGKGKEYFEKGDYQKAREELEAAYHLRQQDEKVLNMLGMTYFKMEMLPQAEEMYVALSANNPDIYTLQSNLGLIRLKLEKLDQAEVALSRALELQPANPKAHFYLGLLYEKLENWEKAIFHFEYAKADKMVGRAKEKLHEQHASAHRPSLSILPFEVIEVLAEEEPVHEMHETVTATDMVAATVPVPTMPAEELKVTDSEIRAAGSEWVERGQSTDKMRRKDVIDAMKRLEEKEAEEEELVEDTEMPSVEETEGTIEEEKPWEKTQPTLAPTAEEEDASRRATQEIVVGTDHFMNPPPSSSLFLPEDTAADISTFLAQTRDEDKVEPEETEFIAEPPGMNAPSIVEPHAETEETLPPPQPIFESRIPTPDEIENATRDFGREAIFTTGEHHAVVLPPAHEKIEEERREQIPAETRAIRQDEDDTAYDSPFSTTEPAESKVAVESDASAEHVEHTLAMEESSKSGAPERGAAVVDTFHAANLDQFSRDRFYVQPLIGSDRFLLIDPHLLEIIISERMVVRKGTISSFTGRVAFTPYANEGVPLMEVSGSGILFLADRRKEIFVISLNNESIFVESNHLLVAQSALKVEPYSLQHGDDVFSTVKISGRGTIALTCQTKPLTLNVYDSMPANIPADALIAWSGNLTTEVVSDASIYSVMMQPDDAGALLRFSGSGDVVVEQGSLWGDRRFKK